ncbi:hypothetical protein CVT25_006421, partial [Psilocybe cyanescens]
SVQPKKYDLKTENKAKTLSLQCIWTGTDDAILVEIIHFIITKSNLIAVTKRDHAPETVGVRPDQMQAPSELGPARLGPTELASRTGPKYGHNCPFFPITRRFTDEENQCQDNVGSSYYLGV